MLRAGIVLAWLAAFCAVNYGAKRLVGSLDMSTGGPWSWIAALLGAPAVYGLGLLYALAALFYFIALRIMPLSVVGPLFLILGMIATSVLGAVIFNEPFSRWQVLGLCLGALGAVLLTMQNT